MGREEVSTIVRYAATIFLGAFLLFQVQPLVGKHILPWFGGTPSVWTTCMLFFQVLLLVGYGYSHWVVSAARSGRQAGIHTALIIASLALLVVTGLQWGAPLLAGAGWEPRDSAIPVWRILKLLAVSVGLPYMVLATTSPLLQAWFSRTSPGRSPYRLYTLSNAGSLLALVSYPFIVEPLLALKPQATIWAVAYGLFCLGCLWCAACLCLQPGGRIDEPAQDHPHTPAAQAAGSAPLWPRFAVWTGLPMLASVLLLAVTNQICQEIAVVPFLWILPLSLYLLSFIICFDNDRWYHRGIWIALLLVSLMPVLALLGGYDPVLRLLGVAQHANLRMEIGLYAVAFFCACMVCHGELVMRRPAASGLTAFYLAIALGGALGGAFVALVAPHVAPSYWELPVALWVCLLLILVVLARAPRVWPLPLRVVGAVAALAVLGASVVTYFQDQGEVRATTCARSRNFYGVLRVERRDLDDPKFARNVLVHGATIHGFQYLDPAKRRVPAAYYYPGGGIAMAIENHPRRLASSPTDHTLRIGICGLGAGTVAAFGRPGDYLRFYEINPAVLDIATDPKCFTYLADCRGQAEVAMGDARITLQQELEQGSQRFDLLLLDAFSSDAVPAHLLTAEAFEIYLQHLRDEDGIIVVHISNKVLDLSPVVYAIADHFGLGCVRITNDGAWSRGELATDVMLLTRSQIFPSLPRVVAASTPRTDHKRVRLWTDDYYNLFQILR